MPDFGFDDWIDAQLRNVPVPPDLLPRLAAAGPAASETNADERLDAALRDVPVPAYLESRLRRIARQSRGATWARGATWGRYASLAASLLLAVGLGSLAYWRLSGEIGGQLDHPQRSPLAQKPAETLTPRHPVVARAKSQPRPASLAVRPKAEQPGEAQDVPQQQGKFPMVTLADVAALGTTLKQNLDARQREQSTLGARGEFAPLPELDALEAPLSRGIAPPRVHGYDLLFQLKHGDHPFVAPAAHKDLAASRAPFTFRTASFDLALRSAKSGPLPPPEEIRVEDFLAAMDYALPPAPAAGVTLHVAGSPAPLAAKGLYVVQLTLQAALKKSRPHPPTRLVAVVDASTRMRNGARWETVQRALAKIAGRMSPGDDLTLIAFAEQSRVLVERATGEQLRALLASALPQPTGSADLNAAIQSASEAVRAAQNSENQRLVFITAGRGDMDQAVPEKTNQALAKLAEARIPWQIVRLSAGDESAWMELAEQGHGEVTAASTPVEIYEILLQQLTSQTPLVARKASLKLTFNPQVVTGYRLLGHEAATLTGPASDPLEINLYADQTATNLYELWVKPGVDQIAVAELVWHDPASGQPRRAVKQVRRGELAKSFSQSPPWFQQGVLAAKTAEALRGGYYAPAARPASQVLGLAEQAAASVQELPDFHALLELLKRAEKTR